MLRPIVVTACMAQSSESGRPRRPWHLPVEEPSTASKEEEWINDLDYPNHHGNLHRTRNQRLPARRVLIVGDALKREDPRLHRLGSFLCEPFKPTPLLVRSLLLAWPVHRQVISKSFGVVSHLSDWQASDSVRYSSR